MRVKKAYTGLHPYRFKDNPLEAKFAKAWQECNSQPNNEFATLGYLLSKDNRQTIVFGRDALVAATVVQWLGSPVGTNFLADVLGIPVEELRERASKRKGHIRG